MEFTRAKGLALALLLPCLAAASDPQDFSILYAEPLATTAQAAADGYERRLVFDAFGRRFELDLSENRRLRRHRRGAGTHLLTGRLANEPGSWVRLVERGAILSGVIRSRHDSWLIDAAGDVADRLADPAAVAGAVNVIYRLGDTLVPPDALACATDTANGPVSGVQFADQVLAELNDTPVILQAQGAAERISLAAIGDTELYDALGNQAEDAILTRLNIVDGIYTEELGLEISVDDVTVFTTSPDPFSSPSDPTELTKPEDLLDDLYDYRVMNQMSYGLSHLITGRTLSGTTAGIAFLGSVHSSGTYVTSGACTASGAGVSENSSSAFFTALLIAHEIGHNLSAGHDGEMDSLCENEPETFIMAPQLMGSDEFSPCSKQAMRNFINAASCIEDVPDIDLVTTSPVEVDVPAGGEFTLVFDVRNNGTFGASSVMSQLTVPAGVTLEALSMPGANCTIATASCSRPMLAGNSSAPVTATLRAAAVGSYTLTLTADAPDDIDSSNNSSDTVAFAIDRLDLWTTISGPGTATTGAPLSASVTVTNNSAVTATDVAVSLTLSGGISINALSPSAGICGTTGCTLTTLSPQEVLQIDIDLGADSAGSAALTAAASANETDSFASNDNATLNVTLSNPPAAPATGGGGGGGGTLGWLSLTLLAALAARRRQGFGQSR